MKDDSYSIHLERAMDYINRANEEDNEFHYRAAVRNIEKAKECLDLEISRIVMTEIQSLNTSVVK